MITQADKPRPTKGKAGVQATATLIIVYAAINLLIGVNGAIRNLSEHEPVFDDPEMSLGYELAKIEVKPMTSPLSIVVHAVILAGGIIMVSGRRGPLPFIASALLLLPCSTYFCVGIPLGLCSLALLRNPQSTGVFDDETPVDTSTIPCPNCRRINSVHTQVCPKCNHRIADSK